MGTFFYSVHKRPISLVFVQMYKKNILFLLNMIVQFLPFLFVFFLLKFDRSVECSSIIFFLNNQPTFKKSLFVYEKRHKYKRRTVTNLRPTNVRQYKRQTRTNIGLVQTSDSTNNRPVETSDQNKRRTKEKKLFEF